MAEFSPTRRRVLQTSAAIGSAAIAGCFGGGGPDDSAEGPSGSQPASVVPQGATLAMSADVTALLDDQALRSSLNEALSGSMGTAGGVPSGVESVSDGLDRVEESVGLDPRAVSTAVGFAGYSQDAPAAGVVWADWSTDELRTAMADSGVEPETATYGDRDLLVAQDAVIADLAGDAYALGERASVETVVDVTNGDASTVGGRLQSGFDATGAGALQLSFVAPEDLGQGPQSSGMVQQSTLQAITHGYGAYELDGDARRSYVTVETESASAAGDLETATQRALEGARQQLQRRSGQQPMLAEMRQVLEATSVSTSGTSVTISASDSEVVPLVFVAVVSSFVLGLGSSQRSPAPQAMFEFEYDASASTVAITHTGGDNIPAEQLLIRGQGFASTSGADMTGPGSWAGSTSGGSSGQPTVAAGDRVTVGVSGGDYRLRVIWESPDGGQSATLAMDEGPDA
jgi:hypothetical protein